MGNLINEIEETIQSIDQVTDLLYQWNTSEAYQSLDKTFILLSGTINSIYQCQMVDNDLEIDIKIIMEALNNAMKAIEEKDTILLADILYYDIKELLEEVNMNIK
ncbi:MAG TPA: hypothetical protein VN258_02905 [Mobilitalea sp.]|nr:hypothetical protein [Mobilitalea sp.]